MELCIAVAALAAAVDDCRISYEGATESGRQKFLGNIGGEGTPVEDRREVFRSRWLIDYITDW